MKPGELTAMVELRRRPLWQLVIRTPVLWCRHYRTIRRSGTGRIVSAYGAWLLASRIAMVSAC